MKKLLRTILLFTVFLSTGNANATFFYFFGADDPSDGSVNTTTTSGTTSANAAEVAWEAKVAALYPSLSIATFETNAVNVSTATTGSSSTISSSASNINLSHSTIDGTTVFDHSNTGGVANFSASGALQTPGFTITSNETIGGNTSGVFFNDVPAGKTATTAAGWQDKISLGKFNGFPSGSGLDTTDYDDDDFSIQINGGQSLYAFAFRMINNKKDGTESLDVVTSSTTVHFGDDFNDGTNGIADSTNTDIPGYTSGEGTIAGVQFVQETFVGIVTDDIAEIFSLLNFDEGSDVNDIGIFDFRFAVASTAVPLPAGIWLLISGLAALTGLGRKRKTG